MALSSDVLPRDVLRHGAYLCLRAPVEARALLSAAAVPALAARCGLLNEFDAHDGHPQQAIAFLRRLAATPGAIADEPLLAADAVIHVASGEPGPVEEFCAQAVRLCATRSNGPSARATCF